jgi:hypothetical protein
VQWARKALVIPHGIGQGLPLNAEELNVSSRQPAERVFAKEYYRPIGRRPFSKKAQRGQLLIEGSLVPLQNIRGHSERKILRTDEVEIEFIELRSFRRTGIKRQVAASAALGQLPFFFFGCLLDARTNAYPNSPLISDRRISRGLHHNNRKFTASRLRFSTTRLGGGNMLPSVRICDNVSNS